MTRAVLFFIFVLYASAFYEKVDFIDTNLNQQTFGETVLRSPGVWVIEFYAPWCQHCKNFQSDFQMAAENLKGLVHFGAIDCDVEELKPLCGHFKIESLPTVLAFKPILEPIEIEGQKGLTKKPVKYQGALKPAALAKWAANFLSDPVDPLIDIVPGNLDTFLGQDRAKLKGLLFSDKEKKIQPYACCGPQFQDRIPQPQLVANWSSVTYQQGHSGPIWYNVFSIVDYC